jgi:hypothetical protein
MYTSDIEKLLAGGATPDEIYEEALRIAEAKKAAAAKKKEIIAEKRQAVVAAFSEYMEVLTGEKASESWARDMDRDLKEMEERVAETLSEVTRVKHLKTPAANKREKTDEEKIAEFLKKIGAM